MPLRKGENEHLRRQRIMKETATRNGKPWVGFLRVGVVPGKKGNRIQIVPDWNSHFVEFLRSKLGEEYSFKTDDEVVEFWLNGFVKRRMNQIQKGS